MRTPVRLALLLAAIPVLAHEALAQRPLAPSSAAGAATAPAPATRAVYLDRDGVIRWRDDRSEVALFGANYVLPTASDYRAAGYLHADRKQMIDEDMAQFARMGWDGLRLAFWGDWEAADSVGNLIANDHLDLLDYLVASLEATPVDPASPSYRFMGFVRVFQEAGFVEIGRQGIRRHVMRLELE